MPVKKVKFRSTEITDKGYGRLFYVLMVSIAFIISGIFEEFSKINFDSFSSKTELNTTENENPDGVRYCDPPNITVVTVYYDSSEEVDEDSIHLPLHPDGIIEANVSVSDLEHHKVRIFCTWGYVISFFPACFLAIKFGPEKVLLLSIFFSIFVIFGSTQVKVPKIAEGGVYGFILGVIIFSFYEMTFQYVSTGRNILMAFASVKQIGIALPELLTDLHIEQIHALYATAVLGMAWLVVWSRIRIKTRNQIRLENDDGLGIDSSKRGTPWKNILCSRPVWMTTAAIFGSSCGTSCIFAAMRLYLKYIYYLKLETLTAISSILHVIFAVFCGCFIDYLIKAKIVSVTSSRRMIVYLSHFIPAGLLFVLGFVGCDATTPMVLYCMAIMMTGANYTGAYSSPLDLAPKHTKPILAISFTIGSLGSLSMNYFISYILTKQVFVSWRFLFSLNSLILLLTAIFFMLRGSGSVQPWNDPNAKFSKERRNLEEGRESISGSASKARTKSIYMVEQKILKALYVQEPEKFTRVRAYSTSFPNERTGMNAKNIYRPTNKKRASIS